MTRFLICIASLLATAAQASDEAPSYSPHAGRAHPTVVLWGDTHLHTRNSADAFGFGARLGPEDAYRFARGEEVVSATGQPVRLARPLDFLVVADHAEGLGLGVEIERGNPKLMVDPVIAGWHEQMQTGMEGRMAATHDLIRRHSAGEAPAVMGDPKVVGPIQRGVWQSNGAAADAFYEPGRFTPLIGYEWTSLPQGDNLHRVVVFRDGSKRTNRIMPFSSNDSQDPEKLWEALARYEEKTGGRALAIPHNGNLSNGRMFELVDMGGHPFDADYAKRRVRWEPIVEVTQIKGDGEAHPLLSTTDEFAAFGKIGWDLGNLPPSAPKEAWMLGGEYAREALKRGLSLGRQLGTNPFEFGMIGSSDAHTTLAAIAEDNYFGKHVIYEPRPGRASQRSRRTKVTDAEGNPLERVGWQYNSAGFAAVWAQENTREAIFDALERKEVYATTGTRLTLRFFGGWNFDEADAAAPDPAHPGYAKGVSMGGRLADAPDGAASPTFLVAALRDPIGATLDRIQIVKGWVDDAGIPRERIYDVSWSDPELRRPDAAGRIPAVGNTVDLETGQWTHTIGAESLAAVWQDPDFDADRRAFYYARVIEIPTPHWTVYDAIRFGNEKPEAAPDTIQERAYGSPIWYVP